MYLLPYVIFLIHEDILDMILAVIYCMICFRMVWVHRIIQCLAHIFLIKTRGLLNYSLLIHFINKIIFFRFFLINFYFNVSIRYVYLFRLNGLEIYIKIFRNFIFTNFYPLSRPTVFILVNCCKILWVSFFSCTKFLIMTHIQGWCIDRISKT